jgi:hypothetical protein
MLSHLIAFRIHSDVHFFSSESADHICDKIVLFSHTSTFNFYCNNNINHIYHIHNVSTSQNKYRWMILTLPLILYPLWYRITKTINWSSMKILRYSPLTVLLCRILNISNPRVGWPPIICINTNKFSRNHTTWIIYTSTSTQFHAKFNSDCINHHFNLISYLIWSNIHHSSWIRNNIHLSWMKFHSDCLLTESSRNFDYGMLSISLSLVININFPCSIHFVSITNP